MRPWRHWTVRARMVLVVAALAAAGIVAADAAGMTALNNYLIGRVDRQLNTSRTAQLPREARAPAFRPGPDFRIYAFDANGTLLAPAGETPNPAPSLDFLKTHVGDKPFTLKSSSGDWRTRVVAVDRDGVAYLFAAVSLQDVEDTRDNLLFINVTVTSIVLLLIAAAAATVVRVGLRPLTRMEETASEIAGGGDLSQRLADADPHTESGRLGTALNVMLDRIQAAAEDSADSERRLRRFLADAAHELRTPLTSIQGFAELYRRGGAPPGPALDEAMGCIEAEVSRMRLLVNDLLTLARLDEERPLEQHPVDLLAVAADAVRDAHVRVPTRFVQLSGLDDDSATWEPVAVLGDEPRIRQIAANLVSNALQHTPEDTKVVVRVGRVGPARPGRPADRGRRRRIAGRPAGRRDRGQRHRPGHGRRGRRAGVRAALPGRGQPVAPARRGRPGSGHRRRDRAGPRWPGRAVDGAAGRRPVPGAAAGRAAARPQRLT